MEKETVMEVRELRRAEFSQALSLALSVFLAYEAPDYPPEGTAAFQETLKDSSYLEQLRIYGAVQRKTLVGILATRSQGSHIALFFVDGRYHRQGIGRALFQAAVQNAPGGQMTVNSSPYAVEVYHHLGFKDTDCEQLTDGLRYTPMVCNLTAERN